MLNLVIRTLAAAAGHARRRPGLSAATVIASAIAAGSLTYLVGSATSTSNALLAEFDEPASRSILIRATNTDPAGLLDSISVKALVSLPGIEAAVGLTPGCNSHEPGHLRKRQDHRILRHPHTRRSRPLPTHLWPPTSIW